MLEFVTKIPQWLLLLTGYLVVAGLGYVFPLPGRRRGTLDFRLLQLLGCHLRVPGLLSGHAVLARYGVPRRPDEKVFC